MTTPPARAATIHLEHWWVTPSERMALSVLCASLERAGFTFVDEEPRAEVQAILMTAQSVWSGVCGSGPRPIDLAQHITPYDLESRIFPAFRAVDNPARLSLHGVPVGAFRSNCMWASRSAVDRAGGRPHDLAALLDWLERACTVAPHPLALGCEPWQWSLLFELIVLALHGPDFHRRAFGMGSPSALGSQRMAEAVNMLGCLRPYIAPDCVTLTWSQIAAQVESGRCAAIFMGDWVHNEFVHPSFGGKAGYPNVVKWAMPGTEGSHLYHVDYIVPVERRCARTDPRILGQLTRALLDPHVQCEFGRVKGALPAVRDAVEPTIDPEAWKLFHLASLCPEVMLPSMSMLQGSPRAMRDGIARATRDFLIGEAGAEHTVRAIASLSHPHAA